ncbi:MAG: OB-fold nucleic acid binding domain-containing protein, partial [Chloroflexota bacterium]
IEHGVFPDVAASAFEQIAGFADYGFCQSHAGSLARLAYETMYIKLHHPAAFTASLLSNQPMGFYPVEVLVWEARRRGVRFLPVDINRSEARCTLEDARVRLGLEQVRAVGPERAEEIVSERRAHGPYRSLRDFVGRTGFVGKLAEGLILAGAFDHEHRAHPELLWELYRQRPDRRQRDLGLVEPETAITWPERTEAEQTALDYLILGFSLERHLIEHYRSRLAALGVVPSTRLPKLRDGQVTRIGGMVICRQKPPTAKGYLFLTLEDEHGLMNVIVRPDVYEKYRDILRQNPLLAIAGRLQHAYGTLNILAERVLGLDLSVPDAPPQAEPRPLAAAARSHDFR